MPEHNNNYTLGRGEIFLAPFKPGTQTPDGERYIGNTPDFTLSVETEKLDHYSSDRGLKEKDQSVLLEQNTSGSVTTDNVDADNMLVFFSGTKVSLVETGAAVTGEVHAGVKQGRYYQLGQTSANPSGVLNVSAVTIDDGAATTYVEGTDYELNAVDGRVYIIPGGGIADDSDITVDYTPAADTTEQVVSGTTTFEGQLRFISRNPVGQNKITTLPWVKISPSGDFSLKGDDWQQITLDLEVLKKPGQEALYQRSVTSS